MSIRPGDHRATYLVLAEELRDAIRRSEHGADGRLPTELELAQRYSVSRQTVRRAYQELVAESLVHRVPGRGTFVAPRDSKYLRQFGSVEDLMGLALDTTVTITRPLARGVDVQAAGRLGLESDVVHSVEYVRAHDGLDFARTTVWLPSRVADLLRDTTELNTAGATHSLTVIGLLEGRLPNPIATAEQSIAAVAADPEHATALGCAIGSPLLRIDRLFTDARGEPVELSIGHFLPAQYTYRTSLRRGPR